MWGTVEKPSKSQKKRKEVYTNYESYLCHDLMKQWAGIADLSVSRDGGGDVASDGCMSVRGPQKNTDGGTPHEQAHEEPGIRLKWRNAGENLEILWIRAQAESSSRNKPKLTVSTRPKAANFRTQNRGDLNWGFLNQSSLRAGCQWDSSMTQLSWSDSICVSFWCHYFECRLTW